MFKDYPGEIYAARKDSEGIRATDTDEGVIKSVNRSAQVLFVIIVDKLYGNFGISF